MDAGYGTALDQRRSRRTQTVTGHDTAPAGTSWRVANVVLGLLALVLLASTALLLGKEASATPGDPRAETLSRTYEEVTEAARRQTLAFLTVDHTEMDPLIAEVLAGSTGKFKEQYERAQGSLKASAKDSQVMSTGKVLSVGVGDINDTQAVVFVAADSEVSNKSTRGRTQQRYHRLKLTMTRQGDRWLTSDLQFVG